jgi:hypothetical protein
MKEKILLIIVNEEVDYINENAVMYSMMEFLIRLIIIISAMKRMQN